MSTSNRNRNRPPSASSRNTTSSQNGVKNTAPSSAASRPTTNAWSRPLQQNRINNSSSRPGSSRSATAVVAGAPPGFTKSANPSSSSSPLHNNLRDRFLHLNQSLVGQRVTVSLASGDVLEGIFHVSSPFQMGNNKKKYIIKACTYIRSSETKEEGKTVILNCDAVRDIVVKSIRLEGNAHKKANGLVTDTDISAKGSDGTTNGNGRRGKDGVDDLIAAGSAWMSGSTENGIGGLTSRTEAPKTGSGPSTGLKGSIGQWDQFSENEKLFNVKASFDEDVYTTSLDKKSLDASQIEKAEKMAKEIEGTTSSNIHIAEERGHKIETDFDEEDLYSGVLRKDVKITSTVPNNSTNGVWGKKGAMVDAENKKDEEKKESTPTPPVKKNYAAVAAAAVGNVSNSKNIKQKTAVSKTITEATSEKPTKESPTEQAKGVSKQENNAKEVSHSGVKPELEKNISNEKEKKATKEDASNKEVEDTAKASESKEGASTTEGDKEKKDDKEKPKKSLSKLNANAKSFSFNPSAKSFTPGASATAPTTTPQQQQQQQVVMPHPGMEEGYAAGMVGYAPHHQHYIPHMQPGMVPMMAGQMGAGGMRYPAQGPYAPYPMQHHPMAQPPSQTPKQSTKQIPKQPQPASQDASATPDASSTTPTTEASTDKAKAAAPAPAQNVQQQTPQHHYGVPGYYSPVGAHQAQASMMHRGAPHMGAGYPTHQHHGIPQQYPVPGTAAGPHYRTMYQPHMPQQSIPQQMHPGGYYNQMSVNAAGGNPSVNGVHGYPAYNNNMGGIAHGSNEDGEQSFRGGRGRGGGGRGRKNGRKGGRGGNGGRGGYHHSNSNSNAHQGSQNQQQAVASAPSSSGDNTDKQEKSATEKTGEGK